MSRAPGRAGVAAGLACLAVCLAYFGAFLDFGWFPEDEGVLYYQYWRVFLGQVPYRDFSSGYTPLAYYLHAAVFALGGASITATRAVMALVNAGAAVGLYAIARRVARPAIAWIPPALFVVMHPADAILNVFHNSPYPAWHALALTVAGLWALLRGLEAPSARGRDAWLALCGFCGGLAFLAKQNTGIFFLWGVSGALASLPAVGREGPEAWPGRLARAAWLLLLPAAALMLIRQHAGPATLALFVAPVAALAAWGIVRQTFGPAAWRRLARDGGAVTAGVAAAVAPWFAAFGAAMGLGDFLRTIFFVGVDPVTNRYIPEPAPTLATLLLLAPVVALAFAAGRGVGSQRALRWLVAVALADLAVVAVALWWHAPVVGRVLRGGYNLYQMYFATSTAVDVAFVYGTMLVLLAGAARVWRGRAGVAEAAVLWAAACSVLVYYPRMDIAHLVSAVPFAYVSGAALLEAFARRVEALGPGGAGGWARVRRLALGGALAAAAGVVLLKSAPRVYSQVRIVPAEDGALRLGRTPRVQIDTPRARLYVPIFHERSRLYHAGFPQLVGYLTAATAPDDRIFVFPALPMVYFVAGRENATVQDYFFGDNVGFADQLDVIRILERERVATVVMPNDPTDYFRLKAEPFTRALQDHLAARYHLVARIGPYDVLRRYDAPAPGR